MFNLLSDNNLLHRKLALAVKTILCDNVLQGESVNLLTPVITVMTPFLSKYMYSISVYNYLNDH